MAAPTTANGNSVGTLLMLILAIWGQAADRRYIRNGGKKPLRRNRILFLMAFAVTLLMVAWAHGFDPYDVGFLSMNLLVMFYALGQFLRWWVRGRNPLPKATVEPRS